jgi:uncharacterized membrane-anchored protein YjiN (DUF445 family)
MWAGIRRSSALLDRLHRTRNIATGVLLAMMLVFVLASLAAARWPAMGYVRAFAEAAMVGGCADWFAVTALFRRPWGLPLPHTAIIPRNKDRIGEALGVFIADNFLTEAVLEARLHEVEVAQWGAAWVQEPGHAHALARSMTAWGRELFLALPAGAVRQTVSSMTVAGLNKLSASATAAKMLKLLWESGRADVLLETGLAALGKFASERQAIILDQVHAQSARWMPGWIDRFIARKITAGLTQLIEDAQVPDHPLRIAIAKAAMEMGERLHSDEDLIARFDTAKASLLRDEAVIAELDRMWSAIERWLDEQLDPAHDTLTPVFERTILLWAEWLKGAPEVQAIFNTTARSLLKNAVVPQRHDIGRFIERIVSGWDTRAVVDKLEQQLGPDLQYIRINGAIVGGLVGLLIYAASHLF